MCWRVGRRVAGPRHGGFDAACLAVWLHANAGEQQGKFGRGLAASDLIPVIRQLLEEHAPCLK
jgi:NAD(P)H-hydrate epimerase